MGRITVTVTGNLQNIVFYFCKSLMEKTDIPGRTEPPLIPLPHAIFRSYPGFPLFFVSKYFNGCSVELQSSSSPSSVQPVYLVNK